MIGAVEDAGGPKVKRRGGETTQGASEGGRPGEDEQAEHASQGHQGGKDFEELDHRSQIGTAMAPIQLSFRQKS